MPIIETLSLLDGLLLRARRLHSEVLLILREAERLDEDDERRVHLDLSYTWEACMHTGGHPPSELVEVRDLLWHLDDDQLAEVRRDVARRTGTPMRTLPPLAEPETRLDDADLD
jgi:hypothetical protein